MSAEFAPILHGLMQNRRLSARAVSRATGRAESTINQLLTGNLSPTPDILRELVPVLGLGFADLLVLAGLPVEAEPDARQPYRATEEIGTLVATASFLRAEQVESLIQAARKMKD
ncbi:helix-turn-helix domain-containing protein [Pilimelia columellifera]|uniref:HTH cro/C1-type domain-containing protein n=1 Tax=Pilimelia columellifera subsp. columellifera TaxID=706583 RepID=A0ABN3NII8_9ACTN